MMEKSHCQRLRGAQIIHAITGVFKNGQIVPNEPAEWPEGTALRIEPIQTPAETDDPDKEKIGMTEDEQKDDPESVARWIAEFDAIPPLQMMPEEEGKWQAARQANKEFEKSTFLDRAEQLRSLWE
jgi:hypothetical protein